MTSTPGHTTGWLRYAGPGLLVAATGVGAGDLATASLTGSKLGIAVLWAAALGAFLKFVLTEGLARWQLATGTTLLEGAMEHLGRPFQVLFAMYFALWSFFVASALMSACGVCMHAIFPIAEASTDKIVYGLAHSVLGIVLVWLGGYRLFENVMRICIGFMFVTVIATAALMRPGLVGLMQGLFVPTIPDAEGQGLEWTIALMGGIGGTLTVLCYGYWLKEEGRIRTEDLGYCRIDLAIGYGMTALFGIAMVIIGSAIAVDARGATLLVSLADVLGDTTGWWGRWLFLIGAWGAVFSSLLGVWQSVPYIFADFLSMSLKEDPDMREARLDTASWTYRGYLLALGLLPAAALWFDFTQVQKVYAVFGALFMPFLAAVLLYLLGRRTWAGNLRNRPWTNAILIATMLFFLAAAWFDLSRRFG